MCVTAMPEGKGTAEQVQGALTIPVCRHQLLLWGRTGTQSVHPNPPAPRSTEQELR